MIRHASTSAPLRRSRTLYLRFALATIAAGLATRAFRETVRGNRVDWRITKP